MGANIRSSGTIIGTISGQQEVYGMITETFLKGDKGDNVQLRVTENYVIQYRYTDDEEWQDLVDLGVYDYDNLLNRPTVAGTTISGEVEDYFLLPGDIITNNEMGELIDDGTTPENPKVIDSNALALYNEIIQALINDKVDREVGKGLSTNDFDDIYAAKLDNIESDAQENIIESISVNGAEQSVSGKNVDISVPTDTSELTNGANFQSLSEVQAAIGAIETITNAEIDEIVLS